jgi:hypothetical protein
MNNAPHFPPPSELSRRRQVMFVPTRYVSALFARGLVRDKFMIIPEPLGLPEDTETVGCWHDWSRDAFAILVQHPSFAPVPEGCCAPELTICWQTVELATQLKP